MVDINKKPAEYVGTNKRLLDRRLELDYSIKEACLKLDISTTKLHLIEKGYIKVSKKLQPKFIRKYELPEDFFTSDPYQYPTKIFKAEMEEEKAEKIRKLIIGWPFKIISLVLFAGGVAMGSYALTNLAKPMTETASFFPNTIVEQKQIIIDAIKKGDPLAKEHEMDASYTSSFMCADGFYSYEGKTSTGAEQFSIAVAYPKLEENLDFSFNYGSVNKFSPKYSNALYSYVFGDSVNNVKIESRLTRRKTRYTLEFTSVTLLGYITYDATIDRDDNGSYNVNIIYAGSGLIQEKVDKEKDILVWSAFEDLAKVTLDEYRNQLDTALQHPTLHSNLATYDNDLRTGVSSLNGYATLVDSLLLFGMVFGLLGLAAVIFSLILQFGVDKKMGDKYGSEENAEFDDIKTIKKRGLPKNRWPHPFIPERVMRFFTIGAAFASSMSVYLLFQNVLKLNISDVPSNIQSIQTASGLVTISMLLMFFLKLDARQDKKNNFLSNYLFFFLGLAFYFLLVVITYMITTSKGIINQPLEGDTVSIGLRIISLLPGNIVWGILAFNLMTTFLFTSPKFNGKRDKLKLILYRSAVILPIGYMVASSVINIGIKSFNWQIPLTVSMLFFSKATFLTIFAILYCLAIYFYRMIVYAKYGKEKADFYMSGNRYLWIKNVIACLIILGLSIADYAIFKSNPKNVVGAGTFYIAVAFIPFILCYHQHFGQRKPLWDIGYMVLYFVCLVLGVVLILSSFIEILIYI